MTMAIRRLPIPSLPRCSAIIATAILCLAATGSAVISGDDAAHRPMPAMLTPASAPTSEGAHCLKDITATLETSGYALSLHPYRVPDIPVTDMHGATLPATEVLDPTGPVMLNFIFTTCKTICPVLSATFTQVRTLLGPDAAALRYVSVTIDPEQDTPAVLRSYARKYNAGEDWRFFTGRRDDIIALQRAFDIYRGNKMSHLPVTFLRAREGSAWLRIEGFPTALELAREYRALVQNNPAADPRG